MSGLLSNEDWETLVNRIQQGTCAPFLGAGACYGVLPLGADIAREWAQRYKYPFEDSSDLIRVAQFLAIKRDSMFPKEEITSKLEELFEKGRVPDFNDPLEPHYALAGLPLPVYITTNYDDFMFRALAKRGKPVVRELCRWNKLVEQHPSSFDEQPGLKPSAAQPVVFHFHGYTAYPDGPYKRIRVPESLVLTEDDYLDFLVNTSISSTLIPAPVQNALAKSALLFIGYRITDWNFRVLLRSLARFTERAVKRTHVAVMLPPEGDALTQQETQDYLTEYYKNIDVRVYWGTAREFIKDLKSRLGSQV